MGYITHARGEIRIVPPLSHHEIQDSPFLPEKAGDSWHRDVQRDVMLRIEETTVDTAEGRLTKRQAVAIVETFEDEPRNYRIVEHLQELVDLHGAGHAFEGHFDMEGEESGDIWRLKVVNGRATRFEPTIVWPEESE